MINIKQEEIRIEGLVGSYSFLLRGAFKGFGLLALALLLLLSITVPITAQTTGQGIISGTVIDAQENSIAGASVAAKNADTNISIERVTNDRGYYEVRDLNPGTYVITVSAKGFETTVRSGVTLLADGHPSVDMKLTVGRQNQTVTVSADAPLINTQAVSIGQVFTSHEISSLPNGQAAMWLAMLAPGIQSNYAQNYQLGGADPNWNGSGPQFGAYGRIGANEFSLDGAPNMAGQRGQAINLSPEEYGQQSVDITPFDASVGHTYGVSIAQTTRAGTNEFHGGIRYRRYDLRWFAMQHFQKYNYDYHLQTNNCSANPNTAACQLVQQTFGWPGTHLNYGDAAIGGPVYIPKIYDGRNRFFWFVGIMDESPNNASSQSIAVPTARERNGDFSDLATPTTASANATFFTSVCGSSAPYYGQYQLYNPYSVKIDSTGTPRRTPICGNIIPSNLISNLPMVQMINSIMPNPTNGVISGGNNYTYEQANWNTYKAVTNRYDYALSGTDHIFFRWTRAHYYQLAQQFETNDLGKQRVDHWISTGAANWSHILSQNTAFDVTVGATQWTGYGFNYPGLQQYKPSSLGLPSYMDTYAGSYTQLPVLQISGYQEIGNMVVNMTHFRDLAIRGTITSVQGSHTIRGGAEWRLQNAAGGGPGNQTVSSGVGPYGPSGTFNFDNTYVQENNGSDGTYPSTASGLSYAQFLLGIQTSATAAQIVSSSRSNPYYAFYIGDTWRKSRKLTILPGIRFEFEYGPTEKHNRQIVGWNPNANLTFASIADNAYQATLASATVAERAVMPDHLSIQGGPIYAGVNGASTRQWVNNWRILPRIGAAYEVNPTTVIRGGVGLFYDTLNILNENATLNNNGFSAVTGPVQSSTVFGTDFVQGTSPMSDPFPATNGSRFVSAVGSALGADYYAGSSASIGIYDHNRAPARSWRVQFSVEHQIGSSMVVQLAYAGSRTTSITLDGNQNSARTYTGGYLTETAVPSKFFTGGTQPNSAMNQILSANVPNPFYIANMASLAQSDPVYYNLLTKSSYINSRTIQVANLVRPYPQMSKLEMFYSNGTSQFQQFQANISKRLSNGLVANMSFQKNLQRDRDYYDEPFDTRPSLESTVLSPPWRLTGMGVYRLPFGRNMRFATEGWKSTVFGGFTLSTTFEANPGNLLIFGQNGSASSQGNIFFIGDPGSIRLHKTIYNQSNGIATVQGFNTQSVTANAATTNGITTCTYSGTGFVSYYSGGTSPTSCLPNNYNLRVFPLHVEGVRAQGLANWNGTVARVFNPGEHRFSYEARADVMNLFNHQRVAAVGGGQMNPNNSQFGLVTSDNGNGRTIALQFLMTF